MERWIKWANIFFVWEIQFIWRFYGFFGSKSVTITTKSSNNNRRILVLQVNIDDEIYLSVYLYSSNTEPEQHETLHELETILLKFDANEYNHIIFSGDFKIFSTLLWKQQVEMLS